MNYIIFQLRINRIISSRDQARFFWKWIMLRLILYIRINHISSCSALGWLRNNFHGFELRLNPIVRFRLQAEFIWCLGAGFYQGTTRMSCVWRRNSSHSRFHLGVVTTNSMLVLFFNWVLRDIDGCVVAWGEHLRSKVRLKAAEHMGCTDPSSMCITICRHMRNWWLEETSHLLWASSWSSVSKGCSEKVVSFSIFWLFQFLQLFKYPNLNILFVFIPNIWKKLCLFHRWRPPFSWYFIVFIVISMKFMVLTIQCVVVNVMKYQEHRWLHTS